MKYHIFLCQGFFQEYTNTVLCWHLILVSDVANIPLNEEFGVLLDRVK